jgi:hypothetical protein
MPLDGLKSYTSLVGRLFNRTYLIIIFRVLSCDSLFGCVNLSPGGIHSCTVTF